LGCVVKHGSSAQVLVGEGGDAKLVEAMGELREAEKHSSEMWPEISGMAREIRKRVEAYVFGLTRKLDVAGDLERLKMEALRKVRENPELYCPTCKPPRPAHRARHTSARAPPPGFREPPPGLR